MKYLSLLFLFGILAASLYEAAAYKPPAGFPYVTPYIFLEISPEISRWEHVTIQNKYVTFVTGAAYDAQALYHPNAKPLFACDSYRRPESEHTHENRDIAVTYAALGAAKALLPAYSDKYNDIIASLDLDPNDNSKDPTTPVGIGNIIAEAAIQYMYNDGTNQLGDMDHRYNRKNYSDYTGWSPINTFDSLNDPSRWQPLVVDDSKTGLWRVQKHITPQWKHAKPFAFPDPTSVKPYGPQYPPSKDPRGFFREMNVVIEELVKMDEQHKLIGEFFDQKVLTYGNLLLHMMEKKQLSGIEFSAFDLGAHIAVHDAAISTWNAKLQYQYVRPESAIPYFLGDREIPGYAKFEGVRKMKGKDWMPYLMTAAHAEHPSGSGCFCSASMEFARRFFGSDELGMEVPFAKGSSMREPGYTPAKDTSIYFETFTEAEKQCGHSRLWTGVHFPDSVIASQEQCRKFGAAAYDKIKDMLGYDLSETGNFLPPNTPPEKPDFLYYLRAHHEGHDDNDDDDSSHHDGDDDDDDDHDRDDDDDDDHDRDDDDHNGGGRGRGGKGRRRRRRRHH